jgi:hypothetical protein
MHTQYEFLFNLARHRGLLQLVQADFEWDFLMAMLNALLPPGNTESLADNHGSHKAEIDNVPAFPEDFAIRGLLWTENYFPRDWFTNDEIDEAEDFHYPRSMTTARSDRILWLACRHSGTTSVRCSKDIIGGNYLHDDQYGWLEPLPKITHAIR